MKKILLVLVAVVAAMTVPAADAPASATTSATNAPAVGATRTVKVHSGCRVKRPGKHGGGVSVRHNYRTVEVPAAK